MIGKALPASRCLCGFRESVMFLFRLYAEAALAAVLPALWFHFFFARVPCSFFRNIRTRSLLRCFFFLFLLFFFLFFFFFFLFFFSFFFFFFLDILHNLALCFQHERMFTSLIVEWIRPIRWQCYVEWASCPFLWCCMAHWIFSIVLARASTQDFFWLAKRYRHNFLLAYIIHETVGAYGFLLTVLNVVDGVASFFSDHL